MKYIVTVGCNNFEFKDSVTAIGYAELSKEHFVPDEYCKSLNVSVKVVNDEEGDADA